MKAPELTNLAIEWLKSQYPDSIIVTEMSVADWGSARIDVAAITQDEIVGVEIKGEGDSPTRLDLQGLVYGQVAQRMWLLVTPEGTLTDRCMKKCPKGWGRLEIHDGKVRARNTARRLGPPVKDEKGHTRQCMEPDPDPKNYRPDAAALTMQFNPWAMCGTLWRDELYAIVKAHNLKFTGKARVGPLCEAICSQMPVTVIHDAMIAQLRRRVWRKPVIDLRTNSQKIADGMPIAQEALL